MKKLFLLISLVPLLWACTKPNTTITGCIDQAANIKINILQLNATTQALLDTLHTDAKGCFRYNVKFKREEPMFLLIRTDSTQVATLLVEAGEKVNFEANIKGRNFNVNGSKGSLLLKELNDEFNTSVMRFDSLYSILNRHEGSTYYDKIYKEINLALGREFVRQKREALRFIYTNPTSFASIAALYQKYPSGLYVFSAPNDALYFKRLYDTLQPLYPRSDYMPFLKEEHDRRMQSDAMQSLFSDAREVGFPDIELPDMNAQKIKLSSLKGKTVLVYFWLSTNTEQRIENNELRKLYDKYVSKGFEIYQIAVDADKPGWAKQVKAQNNPWINVCDGFGTNSLAVRLYNVTQVPASYIIDKEGQIVASQLFGKDLEKKLASLIK
jgi:peroxiredoxin